MAQPTTGKPPHPLASESVGDATTDMFARWMHETEAIGNDSASGSPSNHRTAVVAACIAGLIVAVTLAIVFWPDELRGLVAPPSASPSDPIAEQAPPVPSESDPAGVADALTPTRASAGLQLTENSALRLNSGAETQLIDGQVDARLILVLAVLLSDHTLTVADFPQAEESVTGLRNAVVITQLDGSDLVSNAQARVDATSLLLTFTPPVAPTQVTMTDDGILALVDGPEPPGLLATPAAASSAP
ncbi:hypothetical protein [Subtercola lobariae]|uniref:Uncharacterized protein n=1 Tax=Subtercola lobariae TaxID=1588641 RepID=A0A917B4J0_9MICO|nr:hypothetical protein [Subtercola lobariae]GGF19511.1 hypothetical protein GCM10011399_11420 [Subtercola lobariae]